MRDEAAQWLRLSRVDLDTSRHLLSDRIYYASVFYAHQAAEKARKGVWIIQKAELPPRTHNLVARAREMGADEPIVEAAAEVAPEYFLTRYPAPDVAAPDELYTERGARVHLAAAEAVLAWAAEPGKDER